MLTSCCHGTLALAGPGHSPTWQTTNQCDSDKTNVVAMCDKRVSTNRLVNTTEPVFTHLPSTDKYELRNSRQVNRVLGLQHLDYVANCLPSTVVWCPSQRCTLQGKGLCSVKSVQLQYFYKLDNWHGEHVAGRFVKKIPSQQCRIKE
jgi:hypothetical protein